MTDVTFRDGFGTVVLQPTTLCNLNCSYCYLPDRQLKSFIEPIALDSISASLLRQGLPVTILWHGGEPLAAGLERFESFMEPFAEAMALGFCQHSLQTNATLIDQTWCDFFKRYKFRVGVSLDGSQAANQARRFWNGRPAWDAALRGISLLRDNNIPFGIIAVVNHANVEDPVALLDALRMLGPASISINIEEAEGINVNNEHLSDAAVARFWEGLFAHWMRDPTVPVRQFSDTIQTIKLLKDGEIPKFEKRRSFYPTVSANGDVVLLAPELSAAASGDRSRFVVGNVLETPLEEIIEAGIGTGYVHDFIAGVDRCAAECGYYHFCGGGQASNKFFEHGRLDVSETRYCRNSKILPVETILSYFEGGVQ